MKEVFRFIAWCFTGLELWQWMFILSMILQVASVVVADKATSSLLSGIGVGIVLFWFCKWVCYDMVKSSWNRYKKERNELLNTIRDSDQ